MKVLAKLCIPASTYILRICSLKFDFPNSSFLIFLYFEYISEKYNGQRQNGDRNYRKISLYGSESGSKSDLDFLLQLFLLKTKRNCLISLEIRQFMVAETGLEPATSGL